MNEYDEVVDRDGQQWATMAIDEDGGVRWIVLTTNINNQHARTDVLQYSEEAWVTLQHCFEQLREAVWMID